MTREMKNSGVEWIGDIPSDWKIRKIKNVCSIYTGNSIKDNEKNNFTDSTNAIPYIATKEIDVSSSKINYDNGMYIKRDDENFKVAPKNSTLMCIEGGSAGKKIAYLNQDVCFVNKLCCFSAKSLDDKFLYYYLKSPSFNSEFELHISGLIGGVSQGELREIAIPVPSLHEQKRIADFLDSKVTEIDKIISETKASIENYKEYKQSVITEAVTKGLDKNVPMKDSGIEWIGEIPCEWKIIKIKYAYYLKGRIGWQGLKSNEYTDEGPFLITGTDFKSGHINWETCVHISEERFNEAPDIHIRENDLLITKDGTIGKVAVAKNCPPKVSLNSGIMLMRNVGKYKFYDRYLYFILLSKVFWGWYEMSQTGNSTIKHLYQEQFYNFAFPYPNIKEQIVIANYLDSECTKLNNIILEKEKLITNLEEYKKSLIYEYVTGKKAVE